MWGFNQKPAVAELPKRLAHYLAKERGLSDEATSALRMIEKSGKYVGRKVTFFRIFDPATVKAAGINPLVISDLAAEVVLYSGHFEKDGQISCSGGRN